MLLPLNTICSYHSARHGREEPVCFLGGVACAPRVLHELNENLIYLSGISGVELGAMEIRMKGECLEAASAAGGCPAGHSSHHTAAALSVASTRVLFTLPSSTMRLCSVYLRCRWVDARLLPAARYGE